MDFSIPASTPWPPPPALLLTCSSVRRRGRSGSPAQGRDALDTVQDWPPEPARVMTVQERQAYELLRRALPGYMVLAQVPLSRFVRVPTRHSYTEWLQRVGTLSADLLVCDTGSRVLAVIDVRAMRKANAQPAPPRAPGPRAAGRRRARACLARGPVADAAEVRTALAHDLLRGSGPMAPVATLLAPDAADPGGRDAGARRPLGRRRCRGTRRRTSSRSLGLLRRLRRPAGVARADRRHSSSACANSRASKGCRSSSASPTPMK
jgi:hypothetical protein